MSISHRLELLEEGIENERNNDIVDYNHPKQMKEEKEESDPFSASHVFKPNFTLRPVVNDQKIKQYIHTAYHVIEIVGPIGVVHKIIGFEQLVGERIGRVSCYHFEGEEALK